MVCSGRCTPDTLREPGSSRRPLPENGDSSVRDQQTWSQNQRYTITRYTDYIANEALDDADKAVEAVKELRDRALVYVLAFTGVRGGEILRDPNDEQRRGLRWGDVNLQQEVIWVVLKKRNANIDDRPLTPKPVPALERLENVLKPADDWPVFPSLAWPTLYADLREEAPDSLPDEDVEDALDDVAQGRADLFDLFHEWDVTPSSMNTSSGRYTMQRRVKHSVRTTTLSVNSTFTTRSMIISRLTVLAAELGRYS